MSAAPARILGTCSNCLAELFVPLEGSGDTPVVCGRCGAHALSYSPLLPMSPQTRNPLADYVKEQVRQQNRDFYDCHGGPGTTQEACGACVTCLNRLLEQRDARIAKLEEELEQLRKWKAEALAVEAQWDLQELAKNPGIPPGLGIQKEIPKRLDALLEYVRDLEVLGDRAVERLKNLTEVHSGREMVRKWHERRLKKP